MCSTVANPGDVVIQEQGLSIFGTHEPAIAMPSPLAFVHTTDSCPDRNQIFRVGRHRKVRQFVPPGLHHIALVSRRRGRAKEDIRRRRIDIGEVRAVLGHGGV